MTITVSAVFITSLRKMLSLNLPNDAIEVVFDFGDCVQVDYI